MPTYEYGCEACGHGWELEQRISEDPIKKCPKCKKAKARRLISGANFILKGGGWYADLYHKPAAAKASKDEASSDVSSSSESSKSAESTSAEPKAAETKKADDPKPKKKKSTKKDAA